MSRNNNGFTIIELMLAMSFVSVLLLAIAMTVIQIGNIYNSGLTYTSVNRAGDALANELQRGINGVPQFSVTDSNHYVLQSWGGRLCAGQYSYVWNYGSANGNDTNKYSDLDKRINFVKVFDSDSSICSDPTSNIIYKDSIELLDVGKDKLDLVIHDFSISSNNDVYDEVTDQRLYYISFLIGTNEKEALNDNLTECRVASESGSNPTYCAVNRFNIIARAGNLGE